MTPEKPLLTSDPDSLKTRQPSDGFSVASIQSLNTDIGPAPAYKNDKLVVPAVQNPRSDVDMKHKIVPTILHRTAPTVSTRDGDFSRGISAISTHQRLMQGRLGSSPMQTETNFIHSAPNEQKAHGQAPDIEEEFTLHAAPQPISTTPLVATSRTSLPIPLPIPQKNIVEVFRSRPIPTEPSTMDTGKNNDGNALLPLSFDDVANNSLDSSLRFPTDILNASRKTSQKLKVAHKSREVADSSTLNVNGRYIYGSMAGLCIVGYLLFRLVFGNSTIGKLVQEDFNGVLFQKPKNATLVLEKSNQAKRFYTSNGKTIDFADDGGIKDVKKDKQSPVYGINYAVTDYQDVVLSDLSDKAVLKDELVAKFKKEDSAEDNCVRGLNSEAAFNEGSDYAVEMTFLNTCDENKNGIAEVEKGRIIIAKDSRKFILVSFVTSRPFADSNQKSIDAILNSIDAAH